MVEHEDGREGLPEAVAGFPVFEHSQWTIEGEIERFGAFGRGGAAATGWKRILALLLVALMVGPLLVGTLVTAWNAVR